MDTTVDQNLFAISILPPFEDSDDKHWTVRSYNLADYLGTVQGKFRDNHAATELVMARLRDVSPDLYEEIEWASEMGCFFAYMDDYGAALTLTSRIYDMVAEVV